MTRALLVVGCLVLFALLLFGMRAGWRARGRRQDDVPAPSAAPAELGPELVPELTGLYVGSTVATQWQNRIVVHGLGLRAECTARLFRAGVVLDRSGASTIFIAAGQLVDARLEPALAGKVVGPGGLLVLRWQLGEQLLDTGLRGDDRSRYPSWIRAINEQKQESEAS